MQDLLISLERKIGRDSLAKMLMDLNNLCEGDLQQAILIPEIMHNHRELTACFPKKSVFRFLENSLEDKSLTGNVDILSKESTSTLFDWINQSEQSINKLKAIPNDMELIKTLVDLYENCIDTAKGFINK